MFSKEFLRKIELVVFDLDGTLLNDNGNLGEETKMLVKELTQLGVKFSIATGRLLSAVTEYADLLEINIPLITLDGSLIQRSPGEKSIFEAYLPKKYVLRSLHLADKYLLKIALCHDLAIYFTEGNAHVPLILNKFGAKYKQVDAYDDFLDKTLEVVIMGDYKESVKYVAKKMTFPHTFGIRSLYYKSQSLGGTYYLEIRKMGCSKGEGLRKLIRHLKIRMDKTAVLGDWYNDKSLFDTDALKIAMTNAVPEIKKMADIITNRTNNEDGVAEFLKILLQAKK
ncbi:MAG: Cof-type HAD-IIB family hydrolase [Ignavibacteriales bacterium]|nr:Cof-type HAD-IIB family hydrolase [Ignavibacteriales bacterium]